MTRIGRAANNGLRRNIYSYLESQRQTQTRFLAELVKLPSDNPPESSRPEAGDHQIYFEGTGISLGIAAVGSVLPGFAEAIRRRSG